jgi:beta-lactamase superfamily II metal-dependent hydrolase
MKITFIDAGCGDAIHIRFKDSDELFRNIIIDGGTEKGTVYNDGLRKTLEEIADSPEECVDLWILSHIDDDHIGGVLRLIKDEELLKKVDLSKTKFWYNYSTWDYDTGIRLTNKKSTRQGITLRDYLITNSVLNESITTELGTIDLWGAKATILSPQKKNFDEIVEKWKNEERRMRTVAASSKKVAGKNDYETLINDFDTSVEHKSHSEENASSIAFLFEYGDFSILFTADSEPEALIAGLKKINDGNPVRLNYMQLPHHGSKYNIRNEILELVNCSDYIISADGFNKSNLPNKETLVKVLNVSKNKGIQFHITQKNRLTENIFAADRGVDIELQFPKNGERNLFFEI